MNGNNTSTNPHRIVRLWHRACCLLDVQQIPFSLLISFSFLFYYKFSFLLFYFNPLLFTCLDCYVKVVFFFLFFFEFVRPCWLRNTYRKASLPPLSLPQIKVWQFNFFQTGLISFEPMQAFIFSIEINFDTVLNTSMLKIIMNISFLKWWLVVFILCLLL